MFMLRVMTYVDSYKLVWIWIGVEWCGPVLMCSVTVLLSKCNACASTVNGTVMRIRAVVRMLFLNAACTDIVRLLGKASNIGFSRYEQPAVICRFVRLFAPLRHIHKHAHTFKLWCINIRRGRGTGEDKHDTTWKYLKNNSITYSYTHTHYNKSCLAEQISPEHCCLMLSLVSLSGQHQLVPSLTHRGPGSQPLDIRLELTRSIRGLLPIYSKQQ